LGLDGQYLANIWLGRVFEIVFEIVFKIVFEIVFEIVLEIVFEIGARWPIFGLVVVATTSRRDNKDQMIKPLDTGWQTSDDEDDTTGYFPSADQLFFAQNKVSPMGTKVDWTLVGRVFIYHVFTSIDRYRLLHLASCPTGKLIFT
jgi:hypothetical protein